jgi:hypothetical protein
MNYHAIYDEVRIPSPDRERVSDLVARYPHLSDEEAREIVSFMRHGQHVDIILLSSDDRLRSNLDAFMKDNKAQFRGSWAQGVAVIGGILGLMVALFVALEAFA